MDGPLSVRTINELHYYLTVTACNECGKGPRVVESIEPVSPGSVVRLARTSCNHCHAQKSIEFVSEFNLIEQPPESETINPTDQPSRVIDLGQWLSLFYLLIEVAAQELKPAESRRISYRAALCLAEALKFYSGDDELPPESAFFTDDTRTAFHRYPEKFARQKLRDMRSKLPALDLMARRVARDEESRSRKRWWQIWR